MRRFLCVLPLVALAGCSHGSAQSAAQQCQAIKANERAAPATMSGTGMRVAVLGDSWSSGWKLAKPTDGWNYRLAAQQNWQATMLAVAGSGYAHASACGGDTYATRVSRVPSDSQLVVVEGGLNDIRVAPDAAKIQSAAASLLQALKQQAPKAKIVVLAVPDTKARSRSLTQQANQDLQAAAAGAGATFLPVQASGVALQADGLHPTAAGAAVYASAVAAALGH